MTSAARPTFLPALGGHSLRDTQAGLQTYKSAKDLNAHLKMKLRQKGQFTKEEVDLEQMKTKLKQAEVKAIDVKNTETSFQDADDEVEDEENSDNDDSDSDEDEGIQCQFL